MQTFSNLFILDQEGREAAGGAHEGQGSEEKRQKQALEYHKAEEGDEESEALAVRTLMRQQATPSRSRTNAPATTGQEAPRAAGVHQHDVDWLLDPRLVEARLRWHQGLLSIAGISEHIHELEAMWERLSHMSEQNTLLAKMT